MKIQFKLALKLSILIFFISLSPSLFAQFYSITISGQILEKSNKEPLLFINVVLKKQVDSSFVTGSVSNEEGRFQLSNVNPGSYIMEIKISGYIIIQKPFYVGSLSEFLNAGTIEMETITKEIEEITITLKQDEVSSKMDKKSYFIEDNVSQNGGSVLQTMQNLPGVTVQDGKINLRGNDKVTVLIDGKQTALTGFGNQSGLDNIPASAIERIEIINNPSAKFDANGNAGIINIIYKKSKQEGFNGKVGLTGGLGALWIKKSNLSTVRDQYQFTPKINPNISLNYRKKNFNIFFQGDYLYTQTLNKNEFTTRTYDDGTIINQQLKRNRNTHFATIKTGFDWAINDKNSLTVSGLLGTEKILDNGDEAFFTGDYSVRNRMWQFLEDELKTTVMATVGYQHKFKQVGHVLNAGANYTFHRENEKYFFDNIMPTFTGHDAFKLLSDEQVIDVNVDYIKPLKYGRFETGLKFRQRWIPTNMEFYPGLNSPLDTNAGGWATYKEIIPALYGNYVFESKNMEVELGLRVEYVKLQYDVNPEHNTYKSNGYNYTQPFPTLRLAYKISDVSKISFFYNRRVDRPNEVDIRIFPKYDDAEIIKVGNPALRPQFTNAFELGYKTRWKSGSFYSATYHRISNATITRISSSIPGSYLIYAIFQNVNKSYNTGVELELSQKIAPWFSFNFSMNAYHNQINAFTVVNYYPVENTFTADKQEIYSGNAKLNSVFHFKNKIDAQLTAIYLAPDLIPQGKIAARFSLDIGIKKLIQKDKGEIFINASDILNTMVIKKQIQGNGFSYVSSDYYETQVIRLGYSYKF
jgi:outer membrane receptor protein involved in Fe transport